MKKASKSEKVNSSKGAVKQGETAAQSLRTTRSVKPALRGAEPSASKRVPVYRMPFVKEDRRQYAPGVAAASAAFARRHGLRAGEIAMAAKVCALAEKAKGLTWLLAMGRQIVMEDAR